MSETEAPGQIIVDRRTAPRHRFASKATVRFSGTVTAVATRDLTPEGAYLIADFRLPDSALLEIAFEIGDGGDPIEATARVVRPAAQPEESMGFAVAFDRLEEDDAERIRAATRHA